MELRKTISTIFFVPTLKIGMDTLKSHNFINAYIGDKGKDILYKDAVYLLFKPTNFDRFNDFLDREYSKSYDILEDYDYSGGFVIVVYQLNKDYSTDFEIIKMGKYSKTSRAFQKLFPEMIRVVEGGTYKDKTSLQFRIFTKAEDLREYWEDKTGTRFRDEFEVWEGFDVERETLEINKIKELV